MISLLVLLPCAAVAFAVFVLRLSSLTAAAMALLTAIGLWRLDIFSPASMDHLIRAVADAAVLEILVGIIIVMGLLFVEVSRRGGGLAALNSAVDILKLSKSRTIILITLGIGVTLVSLTGYGVSLLVTIPLLMTIVTRNQAIFIGLIGMSLMTWGALSVAALLGAELAGMSVDGFARAILYTSGPVAALLPLFCLSWTQSVGTKDVLYALGAGLALLTGIVLTSGAVGVEVAGVGGGVAVILFSMLFASSRRGLGGALATSAILPFGLLIAAIVAQKLISPLFAGTSANLMIDTGHVSFRILESPAIALFAVSLIAIVLRPAMMTVDEEPPLLRQVFNRSWRALVSIFLFLVTARLLAEAGGIAALAGTLSQLGPYPAAAVVTVLAGIGAYITGSGITSNALFMPSAVATGDAFGAGSLFAALQHSGAAHFAIASLPVIAILLAALPAREADDERTAMRFALGLSGVWTLIVIASGYVQLVYLR